MTITEALAEIKTTEKRIAKKREFVGQHLARDERLRDPFDQDGGSVQIVARELQAVQDLEQRRVVLRLRIQEANQRIMVVVGSMTKSLAEWLVWRREVAPNRQQFLRTVSQTLEKGRKDAQQKGMTLVGAGANVQVGGTQTINVFVNVNERALAEEIERLEQILGDLDGQLSLKNATETIQD